jgi:hypothetical protein
MLRMKNWKLQLNLKMLKDELDEQRAPEKLGYPATSSLAIGEPSLEPKRQLKQRKQKIVVQTTYFILIDRATQTETEQGSVEDK